MAEGGEILHKLTLENAHRFTFVGVDEVLSYNEEAVCAKGSFGRILIEGKNLKIIGFYRGKSTLEGEGDVESVHYLKPAAEKGRILSKILK